MQIKTDLFLLPGNAHQGDLIWNCFAFSSVWTHNHPQSSAFMNSPPLRSCSWMASRADQECRCWMLHIIKREYNCRWICSFDGLDFSGGRNINDPWVAKQIWPSKNNNSEHTKACIPVLIFKPNSQFYPWYSSRYHSKEMKRDVSCCFQEKGKKVHCSAGVRHDRNAPAAANIQPKLYGKVILIENALSEPLNLSDGSNTTSHPQTLQSYSEVEVSVALS